MLKILTTLITRTYMLIRLHAERVAGEEMCFFVRPGASSKLKKNR